MVRLNLALNRSLTSSRTEGGLAPKLSLADALAHSLSRQITTGVLKRSQQLPTEAELCVIHGVSRITIRRALDQLQKIGLIDRIAGKGTFVASRGKLVNWQLDSIEDLVHVTTKTRTEAPRILRWELVKPPREARDFLGSNRSKTFVMEAVRFIEGVPACVVEGYIPIEIGNLIKAEDLKHTTPLELFETRLDLPPQRVIEEVSACRAPAATARLLKIEQGDPVVLHTLKFHGLHGPLQYLRTLWHSKYFKRRYELTRR